MKKIVFAIGYVLLTVTGFTQSSYNYDDFFYYRHFLYLRTPSVLLSAAGYKAAAGDTAEAIKLIKQAAVKNMYDTGYITYNPRIKFVTKTPHWLMIKAIIDSNQQAFSDPEKMQVLTSDIDNFWKLYDQIGKPGADKLLMNNYIMKGSQGLRTFYEVRMGLRVTNIIETVNKRRKYFESIRPATQHLYTFKPRMIDAAKKLKALYPDAIFPPTTFTIGTFGAFGTADGGSGQLIGAEFVCDTNTVVKDELNDWEKTVISDTSKILGILIHELIHIEQQTTPSNTLLGKAINEGAADFITQLVLGYNLNSRIHDYGNAHENELRDKFKKQMDGEATDDWLYNGIAAKNGAPGDLGYFMGFKICEAYYNKAVDKKQAVKDILTIPDFKKFLEQSGYFTSLGN
ncbi:DUF2268 domain-containing putative Zn-dependent protease [Flavihumibacter fluvii]|uniref:DUF2268 domain-containing putative Zn-dependent protease n=1 Tax=Flavihumibacter fluvii TaxID=2838157 RepID=UPI001BDE39E6|nr:DUF2268 domain-containing putative Zn-dependent protease [Flavihumibacter fluvii]ULQ54701.1 DUF2268 domain-containing putative Zn-dependent protease [Flavihumibacter fluvii]